MVRPSQVCAVLLASVSIGVRAQTPQLLPATHLDTTHVAFSIVDFPWRDAARYVFVQWAADTDLKEGGCEYRFSLFRLEPAPAQIASNNYGCDV